jgi:RNA polymerase sigma-70 factor (ECF subfamily)
LLAGARRGESGALDQLIAGYLPALRRWAHGRLPRWARTISDTADLVQDALVRTLGRVHGFEPRGRRALAAYLRVAVRNRIRDEHRRLGRHPRLAALNDTLADPVSSPFDLAVANRMEERYRTALAALSSRDRALIVAHLELGYSHEQLGCMLGRSREAARMALRRAIVRLADRMRDQ